jgi:hypothetical protein
VLPVGPVVPTAPTGPVAPVLPVGPVAPVPPVSPVYVTDKGAPKEYVFVFVSSAPLTVATTESVCKSGATSSVELILFLEFEKNLIPDYMSKANTIIKLIV